ncbi:tRNA-modifying protein YgfZ [hydrothermal vent metagenome]|uniref:tRNA-modifying protein YgfZ n=1 Tax=hydrothermal vent metagenome TaxID=652676 RepID=A0A3B1BNV3_9ZZZZ
MNNCLCDLSNLGLIKLSGKDSAEFLQGQVTNDIRELTPEHSQLNGYCNPKGHMLASFLVFQRGGELFLQLPIEMLEPVLKRLSMFVLRSDVTVTDASDKLIRIGIAGQDAEVQLRNHLTVLPAEPYATHHDQELTIIRLPGATPRFEIIGPESSIRPLWQQLSADITATNSSYWSLLDIQAGIPAVYPATVEAFIPQMVNMQLIGGVSFKKGCYCGQEIIARTQNRGTLKRRMYLAHIPGDKIPTAGDELSSPSAEHNKAAGVVVDAQPVAGGGSDALVMIQIACFEANDVCTRDDKGQQLDFQSLPYAFING